MKRGICDALERKELNDERLITEVLPAELAALAPSNTAQGLRRVGNTQDVRRNRFSFESCSQDNVMILPCDECRALVDAEVLSDYVVSSNFGPAFRFSFSKCPQCSTPLLASQEDDIPDGWEKPQRLYPSEEEPLGHSIPAPIRAAFDEATRCLRADAYTASAIMCRKVVEGICVALDASKGNLAASLEELADRGIIESAILDWSNHLRLYGNDAAHNVNVQISEAEARDLIDFSRAIVEYVFTFRQRFEAFRARRQEHETDRGAG